MLNPFLEVNPYATHFLDKLGTIHIGQEKLIFGRFRNESFIKLVDSSNNTVCTDFLDLDMDPNFKNINIKIGLVKDSRKKIVRKYILKRENSLIVLYVRNEMLSSGYNRYVICTYLEMVMLYSRLQDASKKYK